MLVLELHRLWGENDGQRSADRHVAGKATSRLVQIHYESNVQTSVHTHLIHLQDSHLASSPVLGNRLLIRSNAMRHLPSFRKQRSPQQPYIEASPHNSLEEYHPHLHLAISCWPLVSLTPLLLSNTTAIA